MNKKFLAIISAILVTTFSYAQQNVTVSIIDGIENGALKTVIEKNAARLLSEINSAHKADRSVSFTNINMTAEAQASLSMLWSNVPFYCEDMEVYEHLITTADGYQIRNIPLTLTPVDASVSDDLYQEAVIDFDRSGVIQAFYFSLSTNLWKQVMDTGEDVGDLRRRQVILDYVEHFRTAYNQRDIGFLSQVFSDDAIIITGKVTKTVKSDLKIDPTAVPNIKYTLYNKEDYLKRMEYLFHANSFINVHFSEIKIAAHSKKKDFYGVLLKQDYQSSIYSDEGYVFLLWDFRDESRPQIHVRTWQPYYLDEKKTKIIADNEIFDISMFDL